MIKKLIYLVIFILTLWVILSIWWYYMPHRMLNIKYENIGDIDISKLEKNYLIICPHALPTPEIMVMCNESRKSSKYCNIIAEISKNKNINDKFNQFFKDFPIMTPYNKIDIDQDIKNNTTKKIIEKYKEGENTIIFLSKNSKSKGIYYLLKEHKIPALIAYVKPVNGKVNNCNLTTIFNEKFTIEYKKLDSLPLDEDTPDSYMKKLKKVLYGKNEE